MILTTNRDQSCGGLSRTVPENTAAIVERMDGTGRIRSRYVRFLNRVPAVRFGPGVPPIYARGERIPPIAANLADVSTTGLTTVVPSDGRNQAIQGRSGRRLQVGPVVAVQLPSAFSRGAA